MRFQGADRRPWRRALLAAIACAVACRPAIPPALGRLESSAEAAYDDALAGDRPRALQRVRDAAAAWRELRGVLDKDGASACELAMVDERVTALEAVADPEAEADAHDAAALARAANAVRSELADLFRRYRAFVPARLLQLDVLARELVLDANASEWRAADAAFGELARVYAGVRPCAERADPAGATGIDACLAELARPLESRDASAVIHSTKNCLEQLHLLRRVITP